MPAKGRPHRMGDVDAPDWEGRSSAGQASKMRVRQCGAHTQPAGSLAFAPNEHGKGLVLPLLGWARWAFKYVVVLRQCCGVGGQPDKKRFRPFAPKKAGLC